MNINAIPMVDFSGSYRINITHYDYKKIHIDKAWISLGDFALIAKQLGKVDFCNVKNSKDIFIKMKLPNELDNMFQKYLKAIHLPYKYKKSPVPHSK